MADRALALRTLSPDLFASLAGDREVHAAALEAAELFGLGERRHTPSGELAQGEKKLLDVASAFALRPEVILLDEPTSGVSTRDKHAIMDVLVQAAAASASRRSSRSSTTWTSSSGTPTA